MTERTSLAPGRLPAEVDALEDLSDSLRAYYVEKPDGKYRLNVEGGEDVTSLKNALAHAKREREEARQAAKKAEHWEKLTLELRGNEQKLREHMETQSRQMREKYETRLIEATAASAVSALRGEPALLLPHIRSQLRVIDEGGDYAVRVVDSTGAVRKNTEGSAPLSVKEFVAEFRQSETFGRAFDGTGATGSGTPPSGGGGASAGYRKRSEMSVQEKTAFIAEFGEGVYLKLPF